MRRVSAYLLHQRGIDQEVLDAFLFRNLIWESLPYHNAVFLGCDPKGQPQHAHLRSTAARGTYKGNAPGSSPEYSFHWIGGGDTLFLFESPIDLLSYLSMHKSGWRKNSYAAACGVSDKVLWQCLKDDSQLKKVVICFPPHKHDEDNMPKECIAEEIYYFLFNPKQGFAVQCLYTSDGSLDEAYRVKNDELVEFPYGYHTTVSTPGYQTYFLWLMAGDYQGFNRSNDPEHDWIGK